MTKKKHKLEERGCRKTSLDKSVVAFQGFGDKELKEERTFVNNVMAEVDGFMMVSRMSIS